MNSPALFRIINIILFCQCIATVACKEKAPQVSIGFSGVESVTIRASREVNQGGILLTGTDKEALEKQAIRQFAFNPLLNSVHGYGQISFRLDPAFKKEGMPACRVELILEDKFAGKVWIEFDGSDPYAPGDGAYSKAIPPAIELPGQKASTNIVFSLSRPRFDNSQDHNADFRIVFDSPQLWLKEVTLTRDP